MRDLTDEELELIEKLADVWNTFVELPVVHPDHNEEFRYGIHQLQRIVMCRPVREFLRTKK